MQNNDSGQTNSDYNDSDYTQSDYKQPDYKQTNYRPKTTTIKQQTPKDLRPRLGLGSVKLIANALTEPALTEPVNSDEDVFCAKSQWLIIRESFKERLNPQVFTAYIETLNFLDFDYQSNALSLTASSAFVCRHVLENFQDQICTFYSKKLGSQVSLRILVKKTVNDSVNEKSNKKPFVVVKNLGSTAEEGKNHQNNSNKNTSSKNADFDSSLNEKYTFDNFVVGSSNEFTHAAALQVSEKPGETYNPLFIYGGVGLGKTHLLHAIGNVVRKQNKSVLYLSSETFTNELILSLRTGKMDSFKNKLRSIDLLLIDDIQFMSHKERTQEEFFHTFNALYNSKNQIVITSDTIPQEIPGIEDRLRTRFAWGLTADLQLPDLETRAAIIKRKANSENFFIDESVALFLAEKISSNVRELEGALTRIQAVCSLKKQSPSIELASETLEKILKNKVIKVSVKDIMLAVANQFSIKQSDIISKSRTRSLSFPRHIAMYLCRKHTTASYPEIGAAFGGRDHSSVIHAASVVGVKLQEDLELRKIIKTIEVSLFE